MNQCKNCGSNLEEEECIVCLELEFVPFIDKYDVIPVKPENQPVWER